MTESRNVDQDGCADILPRELGASPFKPKDRLEADNWWPRTGSFICGGAISILVDTRRGSPVMMRLRLQMLVPVPARCSWKRRMSSQLAFSGDRFRNAANNLQLEM